MVLDVAAGNGNATLAAARRFADVISTDYVGSLLDRGRERTKAERLNVGFQEADAEALPFNDASAPADNAVVLELRVATLEVELDADMFSSIKIVTRSPGARARS